MSDNTTKNMQEKSADAAAAPCVSAQETEFFKLGPEHISEVAALEKRCFSMPWQEEQFRLAFEQQIFSIFGLRYKGVLVAYVAVYHTQYELEILNIATHPDYRRSGLGKRLLGLMLQIGVKMGIENSVLEVRRSNSAAIALYESYGYEQCGVRRHYYADTNEDALVYTKALQSDEGASK
ncbi:ribosomal protein S18-alanine N-acetyltransferase [Desulfovibrio mangrovi]|uniref:ribosomal protein S18-alanine N-acetyltransferase n=1 Tax=Desulfovibrio mangrovi TaxID=2976983 RepID=UPI0022465106|nr:ribosomal protein S18-alanine N-acetyltransferase [Desulfovibrio mangrovi]UZP68306.1 ribosomal protein S18-alanine N-acetyltransferase [Desulfovibrio mangrovi]